MLYLSFVHFGHGLLSYYMFSFLDDENEVDELFTFHDSIGNVIEGASIGETNFKYNRNDKYQKSENLFLDKNKSTNILSGGAGLFTTIVAALAFEILENSKLVIDMFRKNSGNL